MFFIRVLFLLTVLSNIGIFLYARQNTPKKPVFKATDNGVQKLVLLNEIDTQSTIWESEKEKQSQNETVEKPFSQECFSLGPFPAQSQTLPVLDSLKSSVLKIRTRKIVSSQEAGVWVYLPPASTRELALENVRKLSDYSISDFYLVTGGNDENAISLGLYREQQNADARIQELQRYGFNAQKQTRIEQWPEFWLDFTVVADQVSVLPTPAELNIEAEINRVECNW